MEDCESRVLGFTTNEKHTLEAENKTRKQELLHFPARSLKYDRETNKSQKDWWFWIIGSWSLWDWILVIDCKILKKEWEK